MAVEEERTLAESIADPSRSGSARGCSEKTTAFNRVKLPLVRVAHAARANEEIKPARAFEILLEQETEASGLTSR